jgi:hypothetical protein
MIVYCCQAPRRVFDLANIAVKIPGKTQVKFINLSLISVQLLLAHPARPAEGKTKATKTKRGRFWSGV